MTNSKTTQCGIYELPMKLASFDTGYDVDTVNKLIEDFEQLGKIMYDKSTDEIAIHNWRKYNETSSPKVLACVRKEVVRVKSKILLGFMGYENNDDYTPANRSYRVSDKTREFILNRDNYKCTKCDSQSDLTIDHIYPRTLGGLSDIDNLRTLCRSCNSKRPLLGEPLKQEILASGYDYDKLKQTYQYPIGSHPQKEEEQKQEQKKEYKQEEEENSNKEEEETLFSDTLSVWNSFAKENNLSQIIKLSNKRKKSIKARIKEPEFDLFNILEKIKNSNFLIGNNERGWKVDFDFVFGNANNYLKILEGKYDGTNKKDSPRGTIDFNKWQRELDIAAGRSPDVVIPRSTKELG